jgi:aryl-alcohol dehydrogenase-like predicted oxidoreductase
MELRSIGSLRVSVVGLGCNNFGMRIDAGATERVVAAALDAGINFFDTADIYGSTKSEEFLGRALGRRRGEAIVATKFGMAVDDKRRGAKPDYVRRAADDSLKRLGTDYIDLYQLHQPDADVPIADTLGAMNDLVTAGKVKEIGCSNFSAEQLDEAARATTPGAARFVSVQNEYSLLHREPEKSVLPACERLGMAFLPYFPLASGLLTGKLEPGKRRPQTVGCPSNGRHGLRRRRTFGSRKRSKRSRCREGIRSSSLHSRGSRHDRRSHRSSPARRHRSRYARMPPQSVGGSLLKNSQRSTGWHGRSVRLQPT